ncbi:MAG: hypothetical protein ABFS45_06060 [Pseudomonadota bacterium]
MKRLLIFLSLVLPLAMSACDDDNEDVTTTPLTITSENAQQVTSAVWNTTADANDLGQISEKTIEDLIIRAEQSQAATVTATALGISLDFLVNCDSGSVNISWGDGDDNTKPTPGDTFTFKFLECFLESAGATLNGTMSLTLKPEVGTGPTRIGLAADIRFSSLQVSTDSEQFIADGDATLIAGALVPEDTSLLGVRLSGDSLTLKQANNAATLSGYSLQKTIDPLVQTRPYTVQLNGTLATTELGGSVEFNTEQVLQGVGDEPPTSGVLLIQGSNLTNGLNATLRVTAIGEGKVRLELDATTETTWDQIL